MLKDMLLSKKKIVRKNKRQREPGKLSAKIFRKRKIS